MHKDCHQILEGIAKVLLLNTSTPGDICLRLRIATSVVVRYVRDMVIAIHNTVRTFYELLYPILKGIHNGNTKYYHAQ